jgi:hypothetical protein
MYAMTASPKPRRISTGCGVPAIAPNDHPRDASQGQSTST